jgi:hypothetical protein
VHRAFAGLLLATGALSACAGVGPGASPSNPQADAERVRRERAEEAYRALETQHAELRQANQELEKVRQGLLADAERMEQERQALQRALRQAQQAPAGPSEEEIARLRLALLERDAQIQALTQKLDAAIQDVVRAMAKLRTLESKAEAATSLAEAEIAIKALAPRPGGPPDPEVTQADQLVRLGAAEFRKDNYGGALYLSTEAKAVVKGRQARALGNDNAPRVAGEVPFVVPLALRVVARTQVREGPGPTFRAAFALAEGAVVVAQAYKGTWVRIRGDDGRWGWVPYNVVGQR